MIRLSLFAGDSSTVQSHNAWSGTLEEIALHFKRPKVEKVKGINYFVRGYCKGTRCDENIESADVLVLDGDASLSDPNSCIPPITMHEYLKKSQLNHFLYTSYSHTSSKNKFRVVIPCKLTCKEQMVATLEMLYAHMNRNGVEIQINSESKRWSQPWFAASVPTRASKYEYYDYFEGKDFPAVEEYTVVDNSEGYVHVEGDPKYKKALRDIAEGEPMHTAIIDLGNYFAGQGASKAFAVEQITVAIENSKADDSKKNARMLTLNKYVDECYTHVGKLAKGAETAPNKVSPYVVERTWLDLSHDIKQAHEYIEIPDPPEAMMCIVDYVESLMRYPNRQIAIAVAEHLVSVFGGGHYHIMGNTTTRKRILLAQQGTGKEVAGKAIETAITELGRSQDKGGMPRVINPRRYIGSNAFSFINAHLDIEEFRVRSFIVTEAGEAGASKAGDKGTLSAYQLEALSKKHSDALIPKEHSKAGKNPILGETVYGCVWCYFHESTIKSYAKVLADSSSMGSGDMSRSDLFIVNPKIDPNSINFNNASGTLEGEAFNMLATLANDFLGISKPEGTNVDNKNAWEEIDYDEIKDELIKLEHHVIKLRNELGKHNEAEVAMLVRMNEKILGNVLVQALAEAAYKCPPDQPMPKPKATMAMLEYAWKRQEELNQTLQYHSSKGELTDPFYAAVEAIKRYLTKGGKTALRKGCLYNEEHMCYEITMAYFTTMMQKVKEAAALKSSDTYRNNPSRCKKDLIEHMREENAIEELDKGKYLVNTSIVPKAMVKNDDFFTARRVG